MISTLKEVVRVLLASSRYDERMNSNELANFQLGRKTLLVHQCFRIKTLSLYFSIIYYYQLKKKKKSLNNKTVITYWLKLSFYPFICNIVLFQLNRCIELSKGVMKFAVLFRGIVYLIQLTLLSCLRLPLVSSHLYTWIDTFSDNVFLPQQNVIHVHPIQTSISLFQG